MEAIIKEMKIDMSLKEYDKNKIIEKNEIYYSRDFNTADLKKLKNIKIIEIDCKKCQNATDLWREYVDKNLLPSYFGNSWDAFYDSIDYFEFFEDYDLVVFVLNDFNYFMKEEKVDGLLVYKVIKESLAFKIAQKGDNKPPLTYILNINGDDNGIVDDINRLYRSMEMKMDIHVYEE